MRNTHLGKCAPRSQISSANEYTRRTKGDCGATCAASQLAISCCSRRRSGSLLSLGAGDRETPDGVEVDGVADAAHDGEADDEDAPPTGEDDADDAGEGARSGNVAVGACACAAARR